MSYEHKLSPVEREMLRVVVKQVHLKYYPKDFITDYEADKFIAAQLPDTLEKWKKVATDYDLANK